MKKKSCTKAAEFLYLIKEYIGSTYPTCRTSMVHHKLLYTKCHHGLFSNMYLTSSHSSIQAIFIYHGYNTNRYQPLLQSHISIEGNEWNSHMPCQTPSLKTFVKMVTSIHPAHPLTQLLPFMQKKIHPGNPRLRPSPSIRHMGLMEMGIKLAASSSFFWTMIHWRIMNIWCGCIIVESYHKYKKKVRSVSLKVTRCDITNFSVFEIFEWSPSSTGFCELDDSLDLTVRGFSMSLISTRLLWDDILSPAIWIESKPGKV